MHAQLVPQQKYDTDAVLTIPNVVSFVRLLAIPAFCVLIILGHDVAAVVLLAAFGATDWVDGFLARRLKQRTALGAKLDPIADRLYIIAAVVSLLVREIVPIWFVVILLARDVMLALLLPRLRKHGMVAFPVNWVGKAGTFLLLFSLPLILLGAPDSLGWAWAHWSGWILGTLGAVCYWAAGLLYVREAVRLGRGDPT